MMTCRLPHGWGLGPDYDMDCNQWPPQDIERVITLGVVVIRQFPVPKRTAVSRAFQGRFGTAVPMSSPQTANPPRGSCLAMRPIVTARNPVRRCLYASPDSLRATSVRGHVTSCLNAERFVSRWRSFIRCRASARQHIFPQNRCSSGLSKSIIFLHSVIKISVNILEFRILFFVQLT